MPSASRLLDLWERARNCDAPRRALHLLAFAQPGTDPEALAGLDLGERDRRLLQLQYALFGPRIEAHGHCPHCGEAIEVHFDARAVQAGGPLPPAPVFRDHAGRLFRLPCTRDLVAISRMPDSGAAERELLRRCANDDSAGAGADLIEVSLGLSELAAARQLMLSLECEACSGRWEICFDVAGFLWEHLQWRAQLLLDDVHRLASAYGWSEKQILALGDVRRAAYIERAG